MRVKCEWVFSETEDAEVSNSAWVHRGGDYLVLAIEVERNGRTYYRLRGDDGFIPILVESSGFSTTSTAIASSWVALATPDGRLRVGPESWLRDGFWESYFSEDADSLKSFERELQILMENDRMAL